MAGFLIVFGAAPQISDFFDILKILLVFSKKICFIHEERTALMFLYLQVTVNQPLLRKGRGERLLSLTFIPYIRVFRGGAKTRMTSYGVFAYPLRLNTPAL